MCSNAVIKEDQGLPGVSCSDDGIYVLQGTVDFDSVLEFRAELDAQVNYQSAVVLDVAALEIDGSAVLSLLTHVARQTQKSGGSLEIANPSDQLKKIASLVGISAILSLDA